MAVPAVDQGAAVAVADALGGQLRLHPGAGHQRDRRVPEPVEAEVGDDDLAAVPRLLVGEAGREERRQPERLEAGVGVDAALLGREDDVRARRPRQQLLAEELDLEAGERDRLRPPALVDPRGYEDRPAVEVDAGVRQRHGLREAEADGAAEGHDPFHPVRQPGRELEQLVWSSETYEGQRIVASVGLDVVPPGTGVGLSELWDEPFAPVLTNGFDTLLVVGSDSEIQSLCKLETRNESRTAPYRMCEIACWASGSKIAVVLNQRGEILVFQGESLRFARRGGSWHHYVHETNIRRLAPPADRELREAIYESCFDVSFARTGGCIGVVNQSDSLRVHDLVSEDDLLSRRSLYKTRLLARVIGGSAFQTLDRRTRAELLSLDGAMIVGRNGTILAAGAIIDVPPGSVGGGGRTAAAVQLSTIGLGVKVSQDGTITGFRDGARILRS